MTYTTISGDMWDSVALSQLGDMAYTGDLMMANSKYYDMFIFPSGIELEIPEVERKLSSKLPVWKRE